MLTASVLSLAISIATWMAQTDAVALRLVKFMNDCSLARCNDLFPTQKVCTYVNMSLGQQCRIDYILVSAIKDVTYFEFLDPDINFSDHLPLACTVSASVPDKTHLVNSHANASDELFSSSTQLRWDKADCTAYYLDMGTHLQPHIGVLRDVLDAYNAGSVPVDDVVHCIESTYCSFVSILHSAGETYVPKRRKGFFKFWWNEELKILKQDSIDSNKAWKATGKPRFGPLYSRRHPILFVTSASRSRKVKE